MQIGRLIKTFIRKSFQQELAFRFNFLINILNTVLALAGGLGGIYIIFSNKETLNGWDFYQTLGLTGVYLTIQAVKNIVIGPSISELSGLGGDLWTGKFDFVLLKPIPAQFYISVRKWSIWSVFDLLIGLGILVYAAIEMPVKAGAAGAGLFVITLIISLVLVYSILLALGTVAFWYLGTPFLWVFDSVIQMARYPVGIYPGFLRLMLTWVIPVGLIVTVPAKALFGKVGLVELLCGAGLAALLFLLSSAYFRLSIKRYSSASS